MIIQMYRCGSCGAELEFEENSNICVCSYCGSKTFIGKNPQQTEYPEPENAAIEFAMQVDNVVSLTGRGTAVMGHIDHGSVCVDDRIKILSDDGGEVSCTVIEIEQFRKKLDCAKKNEHAGLVLSGITKGQIQKGDIIIKGTLDIVALNRYISSRYEPSDKIRAIDYYRKATGLGLKAAKEKVDKIFSKGVF